MKIYAFDDDNDAILITENEKYEGYLSSKVLLDIVNEKNIVDAKDQNPLTGLAGNLIINEFVANAMDGKEKVMMSTLTLITSNRLITPFEKSHWSLADGMNRKA